MKLEDAKKIVDESGGTVELYEGYSGRGMYGATTAGVTGSREDILDAAHHAGVNAGKFQWDDMGLDKIAY